MKKIITKLVLIVICISFTGTSRAEYNIGIGARMGKFAVGPELKWFFSRNQNVGLDVYAGYTREAKSGYFGRAFIIQQLPIMDSRLQIPLDIIIGGGGHVGYFNQDYYRIQEGTPVYYNKGTPVAGISTMVGLEWDSERYPFTIGVEVIPYFNLWNPGPEWLDVALSVRYKFW